MTQFWNLWSFSGRIGRLQYLFVGVFAFLLKINIDRSVAMYGFGRPWGATNYWFPSRSNAGPVPMQAHTTALALILLAISFPFIWLGLAQTAKRLRDIAQPLWLSLLFFVPFVNVLFFGILCLWPSPSDQRSAEESGKATRFVEDSTEPPKARAAVSAIAATTVIGFGLVLLSTLYTANYGWGLFVALPICIGLVTTLIYSHSVLRTFSECLAISVAPMAFLAFALLFVGREGLLCILMAAPLGLGLSALGGAIGFFVQSARWGLKGQTSMWMSVVLLVAPLTMGLDPKIEKEAPILVVHSSLEIDAPPEVVWQKVVAFSDIPEKREWLFRTGIAYPVRATLQGRGVGAVRRCEFSTGAFVEPIQVWDEPRLLRFGVTQNPPPMEELTPYHHIETPHLNGYFVSQQGQFELTPLPGNRTRLTGTTWYTDRVWPSRYWQIWSDYIIHRIHLRVLRHIQSDAERAAKSS
jgi:uncharacterized membrane protein YhaH (DUF805 family)